MRPDSGFLSCLLVAVTCRAVCAADQGKENPAKQGGPARSVSRETGPYGDWEVEVGTGDRTSAVILSLLGDSDGRPTGRWISFWGMSELTDVAYEGGSLRFTREGRGRDGRSTSWKFRGTVTEDKLRGTLSSERGERTARGQRIPELPMLVGVYAMGYTTNRINSKLVVRVGEKGKLTAEWQDDGGTTPLPDFAAEKGKVTFTHAGMSYEGSLRARNTNLDGVFDTPRGKIPVAAMRLGSAILGSWDLELSSEDGTRKQRLVIYPDLSGRYGPLPVEISVGPPITPVESFSTALVPLDNRPLTFRTTMKRGDREIEIRFSGKVVDSKLTGEITTPRGKVKVAGKRTPKASR